MTDTAGFASGEHVSVEWHRVQSDNGLKVGNEESDPAWEEVCVLRLATIDGRRTVRRDRIDGVSRLPTGAVHKNPEGMEIPVMTTVLLVSGEGIVLGGTRTGTSEAFHARVEKAWLGDGFDPAAKEDVA